MKVSLRMALVTLVKLTAVLNQHYFQYDGHFFKSEFGLAMGWQVWSLISEIFCKLMKSRSKAFVGIKTGMFLVWYMDDILIMYDETKITTITITMCVNWLHRNMEFKGIEEIEIKNWLFGPYNGETNLEFLYIENLQLLVQQLILYQITPWNKRWLFIDVCDIENMTYL